jgi:para-nitrobenzyl esterase
LRHVGAHAQHLTGSAAFARSKNTDPAARHALANLRALSAEDVTDGLNLTRMSGSTGDPPTNTGPFVDGTVVVDLGQAYRRDAFTRVPTIIGATSADIGGKTGFMIAGARDASAVIADKGVPVWGYRFSYVANSVEQPGAQHATDIPLFLDTQAIKYGTETTPRDNRAGDTISRYLVNFAKSGDPNGGSLPQWPRYTRRGDQIMDFTANARAVARRDPWGAEIEADKARRDTGSTTAR